MPLDYADGDEGIRKYASSNKRQTTTMSEHQLAMQLSGGRKLKQWDSAMTPTDFNPHSRKHRKLVKAYQPSAISTD